MPRAVHESRLQQEKMRTFLMHLCHLFIVLEKCVVLWYCDMTAGHWSPFSLEILKAFTWWGGGNPGLHSATPPWSHVCSSAVVPMWPLAGHSWWPWGTEVQGHSVPFPHVWQQAVATWAAAALSPSPFCSPPFWWSSSFCSRPSFSLCKNCMSRDTPRVPEQEDPPKESWTCVNFSV